MLEQIIRAEADEDDEDEVPDDESVNMMIARSNDEYEEFQVSISFSLALYFPKFVHAILVR